MFIFCEKVDDCTFAPQRTVLDENDKLHSKKMHFSNILHKKHPVKEKQPDSTTSFH